jgi:integrase
MPRKAKAEKKKRDDFKRPNGYGTVYKLSGHRRRPWIAAVTAGWNEETGRQALQILGYYEEEADAIKELELHQINPVSPKAGMTLEELYEEWSFGKFQYIGRDTVNNYKAAWIYLSKYKKTKVSEIRTGHFQDVINTAHKANMSKSTLAKIRNVAVALCDYAMQNDIITKNYAKFINMPKFERTEKERFSDIEIKKLFDAASKDGWISTVLIMIYTGMRISEMLQLTRFNVNLEDGIITGGIKTEAGRNRTIPIHPKIYGFIKAWYDKEGQTLICKDGKGISAKYYRVNYYYPALETAQVRRLTPHACRHTFASLLAAVGADPIYIQKLIGHANYATTANIYTHLEIDTLKEAINKL